MIADIALCHCPQNSIRDGVQGHIGIGVAGKSLVMRDRQAAEHHVPVAGKTMHVEARTGSCLHLDLALLTQQALGPFEVVDDGDLDVVFRPRNHLHHHTCGARHRHVIAEGLSRHLAMRIGDRREMKALRGLCAHQMFPVLCANDPVAVNAAETVHDRQCRQDRRTVRQCIADARDQCVIDQGACCIMNQDMRRSRFGKCRQTCCDRLLSRLTANDRWHQVEITDSLIIQILLPGTDDHQHPVDARMRQERGNGPPQNRLTIQRQILFRQFAAQACAASGCDNQCSSLHCFLPLTEKGGGAGLASGLARKGGCSQGQQ